MTIAQDSQKPLVDPVIELFIIDGSAFGAPIYRFTPSSDVNVGFGSFGTFIPFPITGEGWAATADQPPRPKLTIANVTKYIQPTIQQYDGFVRAVVTRILTTSKYLDNGATPDATQHWPIHVYAVEQVMTLRKDTIQFQLSNAFDLPYVKLPGRQCLKDNIGGSTVYSPGLSTIRFRG